MGEKVLVHLGRSGVTMVAALALVAPGAAIESLVATRAAAASGVWAPAIELTLPSNASTTNSGAGLYADSCPSPGNCTAVGVYVDSSGADQAMAANETSGIWAPATEIVLPSNAFDNMVPGTQDASLYGVSCPTAGNCTAVGTYRISAGAPLAMVATETAGTWAPATELTLPPNTSPVNYDASLSGVSCTSFGNCTAVGPYVNSSLGEQVMVATETAGTWSPATALTLPSNTSPSNSSAELFSVSCTSVGNCSAVGSYRDGSGYTQALAFTETSGTWAPGNELTPPSDAVTGHYAFVEGVSCLSPGSCTAVGSYSAEPGNTSRAMVLTETAGTWTPAMAVTLTASATPTPNLGAISCVSTSTCTAVGGYPLNDSSQPIMPTEISGIWTEAVGPSLPLNAQTASGPASFNSISCPSVDNCAAVGSYLDNSGEPQAMVATETSPQSTTTLLSSSLNPAAEGQRAVYTATVRPVPTGGTISFTDNGSAIANCTLVSANAGIAACTVSYAGQGAHVIAASYSGANGFSSSTSSSLTEIVSAKSCAAGPQLQRGHSQREKGRHKQPRHRHAQAPPCKLERGNPDDRGHRR